jgi:DNA-binding NarL/FixJ family response regulator
VRRGLRAVLELEPDLRVVAEAENGHEAVEKAALGNVELAILDVAMPRLTGLQATRELARRCPDVRVVLLSIYDNDQYLLEALDAGARGYVLKRAADEEIVDACRAALRGEAFVHPARVTPLVRRELERVRHGDTPGAGALSPREVEVLKLVAEGWSSRQIAEELVISPRTVERHRENIMQKVGLRDRLELARYAIRQGLIEA